MAAVYVRSDAGTEFSPPSRKRRIYVGNMDIERIKQESAPLEAMGSWGLPTTPNGTLLERLFQIEQHMDVLEQKYSPRGLPVDLRSPSSTSSLFSSPSTPSSLERRCRPAKSVLLETETKGTIVERIQRLEERVSQHSMDLEKALSSGQFFSNRFEPRYGEIDHIPDGPARLESPSHRDPWSKVQENGNSKETYDNDLEVPPISNRTLDKHGSAEPKQLSEDAATREMDLELEDRPSTPSPTVEEKTDAIPERSAGANESFEAEAACKTMNDENVVSKSKLEETSASETSIDSPSINVPTEAAETENGDEKNDTGETMERPSVKPTEELVQNEFHIQKDGGLVRDLIHFRSLDEPLGKFENDFVRESSPLPVKEVNDEPKDESESLPLITSTVPENATEKAMRRKQSFKHIRERIQRFFGLKEADSATKATSRLPRFRSMEADSTIKATSRSRRFGSKEADSATKGTSRLHKFASKEVDPATKRPHRFRSSIM